MKTNQKLSKRVVIATTLFSISLITLSIAIARFIGNDGADNWTLSDYPTEGQVKNSVIAGSASSEDLQNEAIPVAFGVSDAPLPETPTENLSYSTNSKEKLRIDGSQSMGLSVVPDLVEAFLLDKGYLYPEVKTLNQITKVFALADSTEQMELMVRLNHIDSDSAFGVIDPSQTTGLKGGYCDLAMTTRRISDIENDAMIMNGWGNMKTIRQEHIVGLDGFAVVVHPENQINQLSIKQIAAIFSGKVERWDQFARVDGEEIQLCLWDDGKGSARKFSHMVLDPNEQSFRPNDRQIFTACDELTAAVASNRNAVGFVRLTKVDDSVKAISVRASSDSMPISPSRIMVKTLDYPLTRPLYFYQPEEACEFGNDFVDFATGKMGQTIVEKNGYLAPGKPEKEYAEAHLAYLKELMKRPDVLSAYKNRIRGADRLDSPFNLRFENSLNELTPESKLNFEQLSEWLMKDENKDFTTILIGFSDSVGKYLDNRELSKKRAETVANLLAETGVKNIVTDGFGEAMPVGDNLTSYGQLMNRRVEVWIKRS